MITKPRVGFRIVLGFALLVLICCVPFAGAIDNTSVLNNNTVNVSYTEQQTPAPSSNQTLTSDEIGKAKLVAIEPFLLYKQNETFWQKKLTSDLLQITDPNYPDTGSNLQSKKNTMRLLKVFIPADKVAAELNISNPLVQPVGDHVYISIISNKLYSVNIIDPYITKITGHDEKNTLYGWVDINNIEEIASLEAISGISISYPPITHSAYNFVDGNNSIGINDNRTQLTLIQTTPNTTFYSISTTHAAPVSLLSIYAAISSGGMIVVLRRIKKSMR